MSLMPSSTPVSSPPVVHTSARRGFALLITITLLAFLVLLLVSLASLTRVETQVAANSQQLGQARQNAIMALNIAIGQLQKYAGPDQRVTAPANLATGAPASQLSNSKKGLTTPVAGTRQWLGVWGNSNLPTGVYSATPAPIFLNWLVSGNEQTVTPVAAADGHITTPSSAAVPSFLPSQTPTTLTLSSKATDALKINGKDAILLVGPSTAGNTAGALDRFVAAPLVTLQSSSVPGLGNTAITVGRYAYWIGDEGVKAQYNLRDKLTATDPKTTADARYRLFTPARDGIELLAGQTSYPVNSSLLENIQTGNQLRLADSSLTQAAQQAYIHDLTISSWGVLANTQTGGLRTDLTHALSQSSLGTNFAGKTIIPAIDGATLSTPVANGPANKTIAPDYGPTWEALKSFYDLGLSAGNSSATAVEIRPASATTTGISPVIVQNRVMIKMYQQHLGAATYPTSSTHFYLQAVPLFVIGNPYSFPITASAGVEFSYGITTDSADKSEWGINIIRNGGSGDRTTAAPMNRHMFDTTAYSYQGDGTIVYFPLLANTKAYGSTNAVLNNVKFKTDAFTLQPGATKIFTVKNKVSGSGSGGATVPLTDTLNSSDNNNSYEYDTGLTYTDKKSNNNSYTWLTQIISAEALTLQMAMPNSAVADGAKSQPQTGVLQAVINADLSARNASRTKFQSDTYLTPPFPGGITTNSSYNLNPGLVNVNTTAAPLNYQVISPSGANPIDVSGYAMWLSLPDKDLSLYAYDSSTNSLVGTFRSYADFNLTARNFALPPVAPMLSTIPPIPTNSFTGPNAAALNTFETVPPYGRKYIRGPASSTNFGATVSGSDWGQNVNPAKWGINTDPTGQTTVILYDAPRRTSDQEASLFTIGQLQHADLTGDDDFTSISYQPRYAVGNSWNSPFVTRDKSIQSVTRQGPARVGTTDISTGGQVRMFDLPYLMNTALWDGYFFSSLIQSGAKAGTPANQRLDFATSYKPTAAQLGIGQGDTKVVDLSGNGTQLLPEKAAARYMMIKGAFNINSTSVDAWRAVLSGGRSLALNGQSTGTPFARSLNQTLDTTDAEKGDADATYSGYRRLTDDQITTLATNIVDQVRQRGPFVSLAHFVNRALSADALGSSGAIQAAIDASATINPFTNATEKAQFFSTPYVNNGSTTDIGNRSTAVPGWLTQADILQSIGSVISARSDTFVIRVYGDVINPLDQTTVVARAWCEATVQRFPDYVDTSDSATNNAPTQTTNKTFGRKFRVISFRWLSSPDI